MNEENWSRKKDSTKQDTEQTQMANKHTGRCTSSLALQELKIKVNYEILFHPDQTGK